MTKMEQDVTNITSELHTYDEELSESSSLVSSLKEQLKKVSSLTTERCIYRTPDRLRKQNVQAYTPHLVSIGPYHYKKKEEYAIMEVDKLGYLQKFLDRTGMSLEYAVEFIKKRETKIRNSYEQTIDLSSDELVKMILLDVIFAFTIICYGPKKLSEEFHGSSSFEETVLDMLLLENQLPFFIFIDLSKLVLKVGVLTEAARLSTSIYKHCYETFKVYIEGSKLPMNIERSNIKHIVDLLRRCLLPSVPLPTTNMYDFEQVVPTATQLHEAGVIFKVALGKNSLLDVQFINGVLKIPRIFVNFRTEIVFRNLLAFEQCHCDDRYITEYNYLMDCLINTPRDVELLVRCKIMVNNLGDNEAVSTLFNNLGKGLTSNNDNYYFGTLLNDLIAYRNYPLHKRMSILKHDYFNSPWKILSITAALILILLTLHGPCFSSSRISMLTSKKFVLLLIKTPALY